jgi:uncharacterized protein (TIGR02444 family)
LDLEFQETRVMRHSKPSIATECWAFAARIYAEHGVADACLELQNIAGVDVMMLLAAIFATTQQRISLSYSDLEEMDALCTQWREQVIRPLRVLRTALKFGPAPAPSETTENLRSQIKTSDEWMKTKSPIQGRLTQKEIWIVMRNVVNIAQKSRQEGEIGDMSPALHILFSASESALA